MISEVIDVALLAMLWIISLQVIFTRSELTAIMVFGAFSLICAGLFLAMGAADVAFTEAAVGAGVSTLLMLNALRRCGTDRCNSSRRGVIDIRALALTGVTGAALIWGTRDLPGVGLADNPVHLHVAPRYLQVSFDEIGIPNVVTSVLASYRGFDTFGEVVVVFTAGLGVWLILGSGKRNDGKADEDE
jgi:multicomponent Na+:H+ antiporter subunit B